jgi:hypothetical protein
MGCTQVVLKSARKASLFPALVAAWKKAAPRRLLDGLED